MSDTYNLLLSAGQEDNEDAKKLALDIDVYIVKANMLGNSICNADITKLFCTSSITK